MSKGLEKLKIIRHIHDMECGEDERINKDFSIIEKELKAFDIVKNKKVQVAYLHSMWDDFETTFNNNDEDVRWLYNEGRETNEQLTKEEYDLIKEVLNYGK